MLVGRANHNFFIQDTDSELGQTWKPLNCSVERGGETMKQVLPTRFWLKTFERLAGALVYGMFISTS